MSVAVEDLERGRTAFERCSWEEAFTLLSSADSASPLQVEDLAALAQCAYLTGRTDACAEAHRRSYTEHLRTSNPRGAAMSAYWLHVTLFFKGDAALAAGWLARSGC
ncbi:hypothetical protein ACWDYJ_25400 [Streptomyces sp. NPDC003042]